MKSDLHKNLQESLSEYYRKKGYIAVVEHYAVGKKIDVLAQDIKTKYTIANEIHLTAKHFLENILLDFRAGCNEVRIIAVDKKILEEIKEKTNKELDKNLLKNVKFHLVEEFIPHTDNKNNINNKE